MLAVIIVSDFFVTRQKLKNHPAAGDVCIQTTLNVVTKAKTKITQLSFKHFIVHCRTSGNEWQATEMKTWYKIQTQKGLSKSHSNINYENIVHTHTKIILKIHHLLHFQLTFEIGQGHKNILEQKNYKCSWICSPTLFSSKMRSIMNGESDFYWSADDFGFTPIWPSLWLPTPKSIPLWVLLP